MVRKAEIDPSGKGAVVITIRFAKDIIDMLDLLTENRSQFIRDATYQRIATEMGDKK